MSSAAAKLATSATERALPFFEEALLDSPAAARPLLVAGDDPFLADDLLDFDAAVVFVDVFFFVCFLVIFFLVAGFFFDAAFLLVFFFVDDFLAVDLVFVFFFFLEIFVDVFLVVVFLPFTEVFFFPPVDVLRGERAVDDEPERFFDPARVDDFLAVFFVDFPEAAERDADDFSALFPVRLRVPELAGFLRIFDFVDDFFFEVATAGILPRPCWGLVSILQPAGYSNTPSRAGRIIGAALVTVNTNRGLLSAN